MTIETSSREETGTGWLPIDTCPECGGVELHPVFDGELVNFLCPLCMSCWHVELGFVHKINPGTCPGCQYELTCLEHHRFRTRRSQSG